MFLLNSKDFCPRDKDPKIASCPDSTAAICKYSGAMEPRHCSPHLAAKYNHCSFHFSCFGFAEKYLSCCWIISPAVHHLWQISMLYFYLSHPYTFFLYICLSKLKFVLSLLCENCVQWHPQLSDLCPGPAWPRVCSDPRTRIDHKTACCSS